MVSASAQAPARNGPDDSPLVEVPRSVQIASRGIRTDHQAAEYLSALVTDVMTDRVTEKRANTACNVMGKLFKVVEMRHKYGKPEDQSRELSLIPSPAQDDGLAAAEAVLLRQKADLEEQLAAVRKEKAAR
jgi:hypothetical protein